MRENRHLQREIERLTEEITFYRDEYERLTAENIYLFMEKETLILKVAYLEGEKESKKNLRVKPNTSGKKKKPGRFYRFLDSHGLHQPPYRSFQEFFLRLYPAA